MLSKYSWLYPSSDIKILIAYLIFKIYAHLQSYKPSKSQKHKISELAAMSEASGPIHTPSLTSSHPAFAWRLLWSSTSQGQSFDDCNN